uniref:Uncharacterized protein n=1 Tax=viral metagenome TaxID=1070528 RepID=A0A6M3KA27_9ZZZZ
MSNQQITPTNYFSALESAYYKRFEWLGKLRAGFHARDVTGASSLLKTNDEDVEIIGLATASLKYKAFDSTFANKTDLTTAIDATTKAGQAKISVTNSSGATRWLADLAIRGEAIKRISGGQGFIHDSFKDRRSIRMNGRVPLEVGNNFIQSQSHIRKVADWLWKLNNTEKHIYTWGDPGSWMFYEPGEWYVLNIDAATETYNTTVKCLSVNSEVDAHGIGYTIVEWGEIQQNWVFDSSYLTKFMIGGAFPQDNTVTAVVVAAEDYTGEDANYICDGTNDEAEINLAIQWVKGAYGGGYVLLTEGTFNIGAAIEMLSGVTLMGRGEGTVLDRNCNDYTIECMGTDGAEKPDVTISNFKLTFTDSNVINPIHIEYADRCVVSNIIWQSPLYDAIALEYTDGFKITGCTVIEPSAIALFVNSSSGEISNNLIEGNNVDKGSVNLRGINVVNVLDSSLVRIIDNTIVNLVAGGTSGAHPILGIYVQGGESIVSGNYINNLVNTNINASSNRCVGIFVQADEVRTKIVNNYIKGIGLTGDIGTGYAVYGIYMSGDDGIVSGNTVANIRSYNGIGIYNDGDRNVISGNHATDNGNLITNPTCEVVSSPPFIIGDGYSVSATTIGRSSTAKYKGTYSYKITKTNAAGTGARYNFEDRDTAVTNDMHGLVKPKSYSVTLWAMMPTTGGVSDLAEYRFQFYEYHDAAWWSVFNVALSSYDTWQQLGQTITLHGNDTGILCRMSFASTASINEFGYIDQISLYPTNVDNTHGKNFTDGGTLSVVTGNSWQ